MLWHFVMMSKDEQQALKLLKNGKSIVTLRSGKGSITKWTLLLKEHCHEL